MGVRSIEHGLLLRSSSNRLDILAVPSMLVGTYSWQYLTPVLSEVLRPSWPCINLLLTLSRVQVGSIMFKLRIVYLQICQPLWVLGVRDQPLPSSNQQPHNFHSYFLFLWFTLGSVDGSTKPWQSTADIKNSFLTKGKILLTALRLPTEYFP